MIPRPTAPRVAPISDLDRAGEVREILDSMSQVNYNPPAQGDASINSSRTLVRNPALLSGWSSFAASVMSGALIPRDRELLIMRTAWNCRAAYIWGGHVLIAPMVGLSEDDIERIAMAELEGWSGHDSVLLRAADELHADACISDETWAKLAARFTVEQLIEIPAAVGLSRLASMTMNSLGVQCEDGKPGLPE